MEYSELSLASSATALLGSVNGPRPLIYQTDPLPRAHKRDGLKCRPVAAPRVVDSNELRCNCFLDCLARLLRALRGFLADSLSTFFGLVGYVYCLLC